MLRLVVIFFNSFQIDRFVYWLIDLIYSFVVFLSFLRFQDWVEVQVIEFVFPQAGPHGFNVGRDGVAGEAQAVRQLTGGT